MGNNIKIKVDLESAIKETKSTIKTLEDKKAFEGKPKVKQQVENLILELEELGKVIDPTYKQLTRVDTVFSELTGVLLKVAEGVSVTTTEFKQLEKEIKNLEADRINARSERGAILKQGRINKDSGEYELFSSFLNEELKKSNIQNINGRSILKWDTFKNKFDEKGNAKEGMFQDSTEAKNLYDRMQKLQSSNASRLEELNTSIENWTQQINEKVQKLESISVGEQGGIQSQLIKQKTNISTEVQSTKDEKHRIEDESKPTSSVVELNTKALEKQSTTLGKAFKQFTLYNIALKSLKKALKEAVVTVKELDKYLTEQAMVTGKTRKETYALMSSYQQLAKETGATTKEIASVATEYMKQGKTIKESLTLTKAAVSAAKVARVSVGDSVNYLTTALNGFRLSAEDAMKVSDKFAAVAASSATDYDELAIALSKVASQANLAGMSIDYTTALLTKGLETTREAPETMGTALKTIIARMRELGDYGETLEDGTDINNVESQLAYVGIALRDQQGELRSTEEVLDELGKKWDTLDKNQQAAVAKALAGTRQQSRLIAMMEDYERVTELQEIAQRSQGATLAQSATYLEGMEASINKISVGWEKIITTLTNSEFIIGFFGFIGEALDKIGEFLNNTAGQVGVFTTLATLGLISLGNKLKEHEVTKQQLQMEREKTYELEQQKLSELKLALEKNRSVLATKKSVVDEKTKTLEARKQLTVALEKRKVELSSKKTLTAKEQNELKSLNMRIQKAKSLEGKAQEELNIAKEQLKASEEMEKYASTSLAIQQQNVDAAHSQLGIEGKIFALRSGMNGLLLVGKGLYLAYVAIRTLILASQREEYKNTLKQQALEAKGTRRLLKNAALKMAESVSANPFWGWAAAAAILAAVGIGIFALAGGFKSSGSETEKASKKIKKLSNEIYKLNESKNSIASVTSEFERLDDKLIKTNKDLEEMQTLLDGASEKVDFTRGGKFSEKEAENRKANFEALSTQQKINWLKEEELAIDESIRKKRQQQLDQFEKDGVNSKKLLEDPEIASAVYATNNAYLYDQIDALKETGKYTDKQLAATEKIGQAILENLSAEEALEWAQSKQSEKLAKHLNSMGNIKIDGELVSLVEALSSDDYELKDRVNAFKAIADTLSGDALEAFKDAYNDLLDFSRNFSDNALNLITNLGLTTDEINNLAAAMKKLGVEEELVSNKLERLVTLTGNGVSIKSAIGSVFADELSGLSQEEYDKAYKTILNAYIDATAAGVNNMGQQIDKMQNKINNFYEKASKWNEMTANEQAEFIADNAELFKGDADLLNAFESGDYTKIENALKNSDTLTKQREALVKQLQIDLDAENAKAFEDQNAAYKKYLEEQIEYWSDTENIWKASLKTLLDQEKAQLDDYKSYLQDKQKAEEDSLNKRKEAYEKYFDSIKEQEEDIEFDEQLDLLTTNLSKLGSSTDANAMNQKKELENQIKELEEERLKDLRERAQEAIIQNIDDELSEISEKFDKLLESNRALLAAMTGELQDSGNYVSNMLANRISQGDTALDINDYIQTLGSTFGGKLGDIDLNDISVREENNNLYLTVNGKDVLLDTSSQQSVYDAIYKALREVGGI